MKKTLLLLTAFVGLLAVSCKKEEAKSTTIATSQLIGTWKISYYRTFGFTNGTATSETNFLLLMDSCKRDNLVDLRANSMLYRTSGNFKCYLGDPDTFQAGSWFLTTENPQTITLLDTTISGRISGTLPALPVYPLDIIEFTNNRVKLYQDTTSVMDGITQSTKTLLILEK